MESSSESESDVFMAEADQSDSTARALFPNKKGLKHPIHSFFSYDSKTEKSSCNSCTRTISGRNTTNLKAHLKSRHLLKEFIEFEKLEKAYEEAKKPKVSTPRKVVSQQSITSVIYFFLFILFFIMTIQSNISIITIGVDFGQESQVRRTRTQKN